LNSTEEANYEEVPDVASENQPQADAQIALGDYYGEEFEENEGDEVSNIGRLSNAPPHLCVQNYPKFKNKRLCFAFDKDMHEIELHAKSISGYVDRDDGKCHYPLTGEFFLT